MAETSQWEKFLMWLKSNGRSEILSSSFKDELIIKVGIIQQDAYMRGVKYGRKEGKRSGV